jgi:hypothetical protein
MLQDILFPAVLARMDLRYGLFRSIEKEESECPSPRLYTWGNKVEQVYTLSSGGVASWLFPALFAGGVLLQLVYCRWRKGCLLYAGCGMVLIAAALDKDITLAAGQLLAACLASYYR